MLDGSSSTPTPLTGATVTVKGTTIGTNTDLYGKYTLSVNSPEDILEFQFIGYTTQEVRVGAQTQIDVVMKDESQLISEVVVTALGISREEKSLGYAVSKVSNEELTNVETGNWLNSLTGKVAGLNLDTSSAGPAGSLRVTLRGESSLSHDNNTALFVVDGVPINSSMDSNSETTSYEDGDAPIDYGNGAGDLNAEDIESVSVLKGPAATALYGSRAANGAIVITTKSGKKQRGLGITYNTNVVIEEAGFWPDFQEEYGAGNIGPTSVSNGHCANGITPDEYSFWTITANKTDTGEKINRFHSRYQFGERIEGQMRYLYSSRNWEDDTYTRKPYIIEDWYKGFFRTGVTWTNSLAVSFSFGFNSVADSFKSS